MAIIPPKGYVLDTPGNQTIQPPKGYVLDQPTPAVATPYTGVNQALNNQFVRNVGTDIGNLTGGMEGLVNASMVPANILGSTVANLLTGRTAGQVQGLIPGQKGVTGPLSGVPSTTESIKQIGQAAKVAPAQVGQMALGTATDIGQLLTNPIEAFYEKPISTMLNVAPFLPGISKIPGAIGRATGLMESVTPEISAATKAAQAAELAKAAPGTMTTPADVLRGNLQPSTIRNLTQNEYVNKVVNPTTIKDTTSLMQDAEKATKGTRDILTTKTIPNLEKTVEPQLQNIPVSTLLTTEVSDMLDSVKQIAKIADPEVEAALKKLHTDFKNTSINTLKDLRNFNATRVVPQVEQFLDEHGYSTKSSQLFEDINANIRKSITRDASVTNPTLTANMDTLNNLEKARYNLDNLFRLNSRLGENTLSRKILNRYQDVRDSTFKTNLDKIQDQLDTANAVTDTGAPLSNFVDKIKAVQAAHDIATAKQGLLELQRLPGLIKSVPQVGESIAQAIQSPTYQAGLLQRGVRAGIINPENVTKPISITNTPIIGRGITKLDAISTLLGGGPIGSAPAASALQYMLNPSRYSGIAGTSISNLLNKNPDNQQQPSQLPPQLPQ